MTGNYPLEINEAVQEAINTEIPVVALESTIISHGMPYPENVKTALRVEKIIRENNSIPATTAIIKGKLKIGLSSSELELLGKTGKQCKKVSKRDIAHIITQRLTGSTTVSGTMALAKWAGIKILATGGIGGVHQGAEQSFDISADLLELANTNIAVVCSGAKAILDLPRTLEYLETHSVPILGYKTNEFPAFYSYSSGLPLEYHYNTTKEIAEFLKIKASLNIESATVIANPIPKKHQLDPRKINSHIANAIQQLETTEIKGKDITPYLLAKIEELTHGKALKANIQLIQNNAKVASKIAYQLANL